MKKLILSILLLAPVLLSAQVVIWIKLKANNIRYVDSAEKQWNNINPIVFEFSDFVQGKKTWGIKTDQNFNDSGYIDIYYHKNDSVMLSKRFNIYVIDPTFFNSIFFPEALDSRAVVHYGRKNYTLKDYYYDLAKINERKSYYNKHPNDPIEYIFLVESK